MNPNPPLDPPVSEADLHGFVDGQLTPERRREVEAWLSNRPEEAQRVASYRRQRHELHALYDPVRDEPLPAWLRAPHRARSNGMLQRLAAAILIALIGGAAGWGLRGMPGAVMATAQPEAARDAGFARRAAIAHAVYSPDMRRAVEVDAAHEDQLVAWLSKRMGAPVKPPHLQVLGYALEGGRLLPGGDGPVAQFMYRRVGDDRPDARLTVYVSNDVPAAGGRDGGRGAAAGPAHGSDRTTAFRFAEEGPVHVFYWIDGAFGYAIAADAGRSELARVAAEVYRQLGGGR
jgi:anti-sigma factor RsiW